ncbi:MAG: mechanosensitive ion channel family protein [Actinomycetota bacterium]
MTLWTILAQDGDDEVINPAAEPVYEFVLELTQSGGIAVLAQEAVPRLLRILLILGLALGLNRLVRRLIKRSVRRLQTGEGLGRLGALRARGPLSDTTPLDVGRSTLRAETLGGVLRSIAGLLIWSIAVILLIGEFGVNLGPLIAGAGILGVAIGFGSQQLVQDFLAGIFMLVEDQFGIGDIIDAGEATGTVEAITLRTTRLRDISGVVWHIPNGQITRIGNKSQEWARSLLDIGVAYDTDLGHATMVIRRVLDDVAADPEWSPLVLEAPEVWGVEEFGASEIVIRAVVKVLPGKQWNVNREIRRRLKAAFDDEGIEIPFPQRTLWVRDDHGDDASPTEAPGDSGWGQALRGGARTEAPGETPREQRSPGSQMPDDGNP